MLGVSNPSVVASTEGFDMRRAVVLVLGSMLALSVSGLGPVGGASAADKPAASTGKPSVSWSRCDDGFLRSIRAKCGSLQVPLDYAHPGNGIDAIQLELSQRIYMDEDSFGYDEAKAGRLQGLLRRLLGIALQG